MLLHFHTNVHISKVPVLTSLSGCVKCSDLVFKISSFDNFFSFGFSKTIDNDDLDAVVAVDVVFTPKEDRLLLLMMNPLDSDRLIMAKATAGEN